MNKVERTGAPALGNAIGLFVALWAIDKFEWLPMGQREYVVVAAGTICIHILMEVRGLTAWLRQRYSTKPKTPRPDKDNDMA